MSMLHTSVLLQEAVAALAIKPNGIYIDGTFGRGGHSRLILEKLDQQGQLIMIDKDETAVQYARQSFEMEPRVHIVHDSFANLAAIAEQKAVLGKVDGILLDLGVSSPQFDNPERGFSFQADGPLDMRMDQTQTLDASTWINQVSETEMADTFFKYADERYNRRIAKAVVAARREQKITSTLQLADIIKKAHPRWEPNKHPATRCFQAIRILINHELDDLSKGLTASLSALRPDGRLAVISFHSTEDRMVKQFIERHAKGEKLPRHLPLIKPIELLLNKIGKAIKPTESEIQNNIRARSAVLRVAERTHKEINDECSR
jgi:16S rRNA (cytosine1402-N4)-methyltransferase